MAQNLSDMISNIMYISNIQHVVIYLNSLLVEIFSLLPEATDCCCIIKILKTFAKKCKIEDDVDR